MLVGPTPDKPFDFAEKVTGCRGTTRSNAQKASLDQWLHPQMESSPLKTLWTSHFE
jgi:hypothetical protein